VGRTNYANENFLDGDQIGSMRVKTQRMSIADTELGAGCDVVYSGALSNTERDILRNDLAGHPVLTISEDDEACSDSNMFCLVIRDQHVSFAVNLDSVARSGVNINPQVLLLGRRSRPSP